MNNSAINITTALAALVLAGLCTALPVYQWASIPQTTLLQILAGTSAFALSICKLTFFPIAYANLETGRRLAAICLFVSASIALAVSVTATRDLLENITGEREQIKTAGSLAYQNAMNELADLNAEIETLNALLAADQAGGYRQRAYQNYELLEKARQRRADVAAHAESMATAAGEGQGADFGKNLSLSIAGQQISLKASTGTALALHLACIFAVLAVTAWRPEKTTRQRAETPVEPRRVEPARSAPKPAPAPSIETIAKTKPAPAPPEVQKPNAVLAVDQIVLAERIVRGEFGNTPVLRNIVKGGEITGGFRRVKQVFDHLVERGDMIQSSRKFELTQQTI